MKINNIDLDENVYVIAEIGGNHNGDADIAFRLVEEAANAGADAVKFQTYSAEKLVHPSMEPLPIVKKHYDTQLDRFKSLEFDWDIYEKIIKLCEKLNIDFLTTPFDLEILHKTASFMNAIKISSGDLTYTQLIQAAVEKNNPVIISTGMADLNEIREVVSMVPDEQCALLHCVSVYPLPDELVNLNTISTLKNLFPDITIGYSDHSIGYEACLAAVSLGARIIEKHFTLDRSQIPGDHKLSLEPAQLEEMIIKIKRINTMLGDGKKDLTDAEVGMREKMRRGIYAQQNIGKSELINNDDLLIIRPTSEFSPSEASKIVGKKAAHDIDKYKSISADDITD